MAPVLSEPDKDPESPRRPAGVPPEPLCRRLPRHLHALLKSNLKNLLADCGGPLDLCAAGRLPCHFSPPGSGAMKNVLGDHCKPTNGIMDSEKPEKQDNMGLHSANSNIEELLNNKKQFASSLVSRSPPSDLADMIHEFETLAETAPLGSTGNGHVPPEEMQMITQLVTSMDEDPPVAAAVEAPPAPPVPAEPPPAAPAPPTVVGTRTRQTRLAGRSAQLLRRLRTLQARTARQQTTAQSSALLERLSAAQSASAAAGSSSASSTVTAGTAATTSSLAAPAAAGAGGATTAAATGDITAMLRSPNAKHFSTTQLVNLVLNNKSAAAAATPAPPAAPVPAPPSEVASCSARAERELAAAAARPAGLARRHLERLAAAADSDATESSSGGESGDEFEPGWDDEALERAAPIRRRALWRWATQRSALATRWAWLAAQVTDLEFRVRQLRLLHRQLRAATPRPAVGLPARELGGAGDACSGALRQLDKASDAADAGDGQCARTRPRPAAGRRRVFSVVNAARRASGGAPARCRCEPGRDACVTCAGRPDGGGRLRPETQPARERRALLAPGHHPVLSLPAEAALSLGYDALLRSPRWQQNHLHTRPRGPRLVAREQAGPTTVTAATAAAAAASVAGAETTAAAMGSAAASSPLTPITPNTSGRPSFHRRKSVLKRLCELEGGGGGEPSLGGSNGRVGRPHKLSRRSRSSSVCDARPASGPSPDDDPTWTPGRQSPERRTGHRAARHRQNSYDIDNIVIPASMASQTKIEKPKYKEIVTPGWRSVELGPAAAENGEPSSPRSPEAAEPLDDASFERRHQPAELEERRRLYQALPASTGKPPGGAAAAAAGGGPAQGRGRRGHTPDAPRSADAGPDADRPRLLRYLYSFEPCGFPARQFPLSDKAMKELQASENVEGSLIHGWRSPRSRSVTGGSDSAAGAEDQRPTK